MTELVQKVRQMAEFEAQMTELQQEQAQLEKEVFDLNISAHNTQVDAAAIERVGLKRLFLQITGTYEDRLAEAQHTARTAKSQHAFAAARLENINIQLAQIQQSLSQLHGCEYTLSAALQEKLGSNPCAEEEYRVLALNAAISAGAALCEASKTLREALDTAQEWIGVRPPLYYAIDEMRQAERQAQEQLNGYMKLLHSLQQWLGAVGYSLEIQQTAPFDQNYLTGLLTGFMTGNRYWTVQQQLVQIDRQWSNLLPRLIDQSRQARLAWMDALCCAANS